MSVDIAWETITAGPDGAELCEKIRDFIHDRFQQITLPRFINSVHVHSFDFGSSAPEIEIKDICDPLPDFYEDDEDEEDEEDITPHSDLQHRDSTSPPGPPTTASVSQNRQPFIAEQAHYQPPTIDNFSDRSRRDNSTTGERSRQGSHQSSSIDALAGLFSRSNTSGIPGGTSNLSYFHLPVGGLSGAQTPLAAVASGTPFSPGPWHHDIPGQGSFPFANNKINGLKQTSPTTNSPLARASTTSSAASTEVGSPFDPASPESRPVTFTPAEKVSDDLNLEDLPVAATPPDRQSQPSDLQVVARVQYAGDVRMMLTAEILLDYPMPSFVSIPLKLSITGVTFDGVAILAYIKRRMHFCFLDPEDADAMIGDQIGDDTSSNQQWNKSKSMNGLLKEIHVESEIGRQGRGKQALKNVGKVEKFVLEQVRTIFEDEFVFPSFWTFLV